MNSRDERNKIIEAINTNHLQSAIRMMTDMAVSAGNHEAIDDVNRCENIYNGMLQYLGVEDPSRKDMYVELKEMLYRCADTIHYYKEKRDSSSIYFSTARTLDITKRDMPTIVNNILDTCRKSRETKDPAIKEQYGQAISDGLEELFNVIWTTPHINNGDSHLLINIFEDEVFGRETQQQICTALLLSLVAYFDVEKLHILLEAGTVGVWSEDVAARAYVGVIITLWLYKDRISGNKKIIKLIERYEDFLFKPGLVEGIVTEINQAIDTDRINKKMEEEILPGIQNLHSNFMSRFKDEKERKMLLQPEMNPEWEEMLSKTGLKDKLQEFSELQMEGGDMMMLAFSQLKSYDFFRKVSNWFKPFSFTDCGLDGKNQAEMEFIFDLKLIPDTICDSDKYSLTLTLSRMPEAQRHPLIEQLKEQFEQIKVERISSLSKSLKSNILVKAQMYIRCIYRFDRLYKQRTSLNSIIPSFINGMELPVVSDLFSDDEKQIQEAEFFLSRGYHKMAADMYDKLLLNDEFKDNERYGETLQKAGYAHQCLGERRPALDLYLKAECFATQNKWLLKKIAELYRAENDARHAEDYYRHAMQYYPDDITLTHSLGNALFDQQRYKEALKCYYKVNYIKGDTIRTWRPIAWCEYMEGNYDTATSYYKKIFTDSNADSQDYINAGHLALAEKDIDKAVVLYKRSIELHKQGEKEGRKAFIAALRSDKEILLDKGMEQYELDLVSDKVLFY
jgi:tetratricopeptide (TPR) repeat protein